MQLNSVRQPKPNIFPPNLVRYTINLSPRAYMEVIQARFIDLKLFPDLMKTDIEFYNITDQSIEFTVAVVDRKQRYIVAVEGDVIRDTDDTILELRGYVNNVLFIILIMIASLLMFGFLAMNHQSSYIFFEAYTLFNALLYFAALYANIRRVRLLIQQLI